MRYSRRFLCAIAVSVVWGCQLKQALRAPVSEAGSASHDSQRSNQSAMMQSSGAGLRAGPPARTPGAQLVAGLQSYDAGKFKHAAETLQSAVDHGLPRREEVVARKHLAFIYCMSNREQLCRDEFKKVLELNPQFDLEPTESGHPHWGPVFRSVKGRP